MQTRRRIMLEGLGYAPGFGAAFLIGNAGNQEGTGRSALDAVILRGLSGAPDGLCMACVASLARERSGSLTEPRRHGERPQGLRPL